MSTIARLEKEALNLSPEEREQLTLTVWESIGEISFPDPESVEIALRRDQEIESGEIRAVGQAEFIRRTNGSK